MDYRVDRMKSLIIDTFLKCLEKEEFSAISVGYLADAAKINRSTFYRHFKDKYHLRDYIIDHVIQEFISYLDVNFLDIDIEQESKYSAILQKSLEKIHTQKRALEILWSQKQLGRNLFEEMILSGSKKIEAAIIKHDNISVQKKEYADWYSHLLLNNMLVTIRWWFTHDNQITSKQITEMMKLHMIAGTIPTLKTP